MLPFHYHELGSHFDDPGYNEVALKGQGRCGRELSLSLSLVFGAFDNSGVVPSVNNNCER